MFNSQKQILPGSRVRYARAYLKKVEGEKKNNNNIQK